MNHSTLGKSRIETLSTVVAEASGKPPDFKEIEVSSLVGWIGKQALLQREFNHKKIYSPSLHFNFLHNRKSRNRSTFQTHHCQIEVISTQKSVCINVKCHVTWCFFLIGWRLYLLSMNCRDQKLCYKTHSTLDLFCCCFFGVFFFWIQITFCEQTSEYNYFYHLLKLTARPSRPWSISLSCW